MQGNVGIMSVRTRACIALRDLSVAIIIGSAIGCEAVQSDRHDPMLRYQVDASGESGADNDVSSGDMTVIDGPTYNENGDLLRPNNYETWAFAVSNLNLVFAPITPAEDGEARVYNNIFVSPGAYREFLRSGTWPERTMLLTDLRRARANPTVPEAALVQGELIALAAAVKDHDRYGGNGWRYFAFDNPKGRVDTAQPLDPGQRCYSCHEQHSATDNTFVQFYPMLYPVAKSKNTIRPDFDPTRRIE